MHNQTQATLQDRNGPAFFRKTAITVGVIYLIGMVVGVVGNGVIQAILSVPDHLAIVTANSLLLGICGVLLLLASAGDAAHGILMFPVLKQHSERLAFGYLGYRIVDAVFIAFSALFLLLQLIWGLVGYASLLGGSVLQIVGFDLQLIHVIPGGLWELFIGVWLIVKGFSPVSIPEERTSPTLAPSLNPAN